MHVWQAPIFWSIVSYKCEVNSLYLVSVLLAVGPMYTFHSRYSLFSNFRYFVVSDFIFCYPNTRIFLRPNTIFFFFPIFFYNGTVILEMTLNFTRFMIPVSIFVNKGGFWTLLLIFFECLRFSLSILLLKNPMISATSFLHFNSFW